MQKDTSFGTKRLVIMAFLTALYIVLDRYGSYSVWNMRIGFAFVAPAVCGMLFGPLYAGLSAAAGDVLGMMLAPTGPYFPGFTLTAFLTGTVFGFCLHKKQGWQQICAAVVVNQLLLSLLLQTLWISVTYGASYFALLPTRVTQCLIMMPVQLVVLMLIAKPVTVSAKKMMLTG